MLWYIPPTLERFRNHIQMLLEDDAEELGDIAWVEVVPTNHLALDRDELIRMNAIFHHRDGRNFAVEYEFTFSSTVLRAD